MSAPAPRAQRWWNWKYIAIGCGGLVAGVLVACMLLALLGSFFGTGNSSISTGSSPASAARPIAEAPRSAPSPRPTATQEATATAFPEPTSTIAPTDTVQPTRTPRPTAAPQPTATTQPIDTPVPPTPTLPIHIQAGMPAPSINLQQATVVDVVDGDTIKVNLDGAVETVRLIGIDTPESVDRRSPVECYGVEASEQTQDLLTGATVYLEVDPSQDTRDRYDRLLRYVWLEDGTLVNLALIQQGYAYEYTYEAAYRYQAEFQEAQRDAEREQQGLWSPTTCAGARGAVEPTATPGPARPTPVPPTPRPVQPTAKSNDQCDPSYPDVCIPPRSVGGDLDCGDISFGRFTVRPPDPHGFDGDNDGVGCESN